MHMPTRPSTASLIPSSSHGALRLAATCGGPRALGGLRGLAAGASLAALVLLAGSATAHAKQPGGFWRWWGLGYGPGLHAYNCCDPCAACGGGHAAGAYGHWHRQRVWQAPPGAWTETPATQSPTHIESEPYTAVRSWGTATGL